MSIERGHHPHNPEQTQHKVESFTSKESDRQHNHEKVENKAHGTHEQIQHIQAKVETQAISGKEYSRGEDSESKQHPVLISKQLKQMAFSRALTRTRKQLNAPDKVFSKLIHVDAIDKASEATSKTIARPSAMLGGAIFALIGSIGFLMMVKKYGYEYNFFVFFLLFGAGYLTGLTLELIIKILSRSRTA